MCCECNPVQLLCCGTSHREIPTSQPTFLTSSLLTAAGVIDTVPRHVSRTDPAVSYSNSAVLHPLSVYFFFVPPEIRSTLSSFDDVSWLCNMRDETNVTCFKVLLQYGVTEKDPR